MLHEEAAARARTAPHNAPPPPPPVTLGDSPADRSPGGASSSPKHHDHHDDKDKTKQPRSSSPPPPHHYFYGPASLRTDIEAAMTAAKLEKQAQDHEASSLPLNLDAASLEEAALAAAEAAVGFIPIHHSRREKWIRFLKRLFKIAFRPKGRKEWIQFVCLWILIILIIVAIIWKLYPILVDDVLAPAVDGIKNHIPRAGIVCIVLMWISLIPLVLFTTFPAIIVASQVFPLYSAWAICFVGWTIGMILPFLIARRYLPRYAAKIQQRYRHVDAIFQSIDVYGVFRIIFLLRFSAIPWAVISYLAASHPNMAGQFWRYLAASLTAAAPMLVIACMTATQIFSISDIIKGNHVPAVQHFKIWSTIGSSLLVLSGGFLIYRRMLRRVTKMRHEKEAAAREAAEQGGSVVVVEGGGVEEGGGGGVKTNAIHPLPCPPPPPPTNMDSVTVVG